MAGVPHRFNGGPSRISINVRKVGVPRRFNGGPSRISIDVRNAGVPHRFNGGPSRISIDVRNAGVPHRFNGGPSRISIDVRNAGVPHRFNGGPSRISIDVRNAGVPRRLTVGHRGFDRCPQRGGAPPFQRWAITVTDHKRFCFSQYSCRFRQGLSIVERGSLLSASLRARLGRCSAGSRSGDPAVIPPR
jgi:hypothetical protein